MVRFLLSILSVNPFALACAEELSATSFKLRYFKSAFLEQDNQAHVKQT